MPTSTVIKIDGIYHPYTHELMQQKLRKEYLEAHTAYICLVEKSRLVDIENIQEIRQVSSDKEILESKIKELHQQLQEIRIKIRNR